VLTFWADEKAADAGLASGYYAEQVQKFVTFFHPLRDARPTTWDSPTSRVLREEREAMSTLFGIPVDSVLVALVAALAIALGGIAVLAARNRAFRLGIRNARRRPARTALIVACSMLGTTIIASAPALALRQATHTR
jgi:hypothetical protein